MRRKKRRIWKKKGPPAKLMAPLVGLDTNIPSQLPERMSNSLNSRKGSEKDVQKGNLRLRFIKSFWDCSTSVMYAVRAHLKAAIAITIVTGFNLILEHFGIDLKPLGSITGIVWVWLVIEFVQDLTGIRIKDWIINKLNAFLI